RLRVADAEKSAATMEIVGRVDGPDIDVGFFSAFDGSVDVRILKTEAAAAEIVDSGPDEEDGVATTGRRPPLHKIQDSEIRAGDGAGGTDGNAQRFCREFVILSEVLGHDDRSVASVTHGDVGRFGL